MKIEGEGQRLRIYVGESDRWEGRPLYEALVRAAREQGLAGATALRGIEGFGASSRIHTVKVLRLSEDLPIVVEIVDRPERIAAFMTIVDGMVAEGMVTIESVNILLYRQHDKADQSADDELQLDTSDDQSSPASTRSSSVPMTDRSRQILDGARESCASSRRVFVDSVDVLLAMLHESGGLAGRVLEDLHIDVRTVERSLRDEVSRDAPSDSFLAALETKSFAEAKWLQHHYVGTEHLLLALCEIRPTAATDILMRLGVQPRDICENVLQILGHQDDWQRWLADHPDM